MATSQWSGLPSSLLGPHWAGPPCECPRAGPVQSAPSMHCSHRQISIKVKLQPCYYCFVVIRGWVHWWLLQNSINNVLKRWEGEVPCFGHILKGPKWKYQKISEDRHSISCHVRQRSKNYWAPTIYWVLFQVLTCQLVFTIKTVTEAQIKHGQ